MATPVIYDIRNDAHAERFGLARWERDFLLGCCTPRRGGRPTRIGIHIQDGNTVGSLDWWVNGYINGRKVQASATVLIQRDGSVLRCIPEQFAPWTQGDVQSPQPQAASILRESADPNQPSLTIEFEGKAGQPLTPEQLAAGIWQVREWEREYDIAHTMANVLPHSAINSVTRSRCPGELVFNAVFDGVSAVGKGEVPAPVDFAKPTPPPIIKVGDISGLKQTVTAGSVGVNRRREPMANAPLTGPLITAGTTFLAIGVVAGQVVEGEGRWWVGSSGSFVWVGGTVEKPA